LYFYFMLNWESCKEIQNFIGGKYEDAINGASITNINPATNTAIGTLPNSNEEDVSKAVIAAKAVQLNWANTPAEQRFKILNKIADLIDENLEELALAECIDNGKPLTLCRRVDIPRASANFRFFATGAMHFASESHGMENIGVNYTLRQPVGIVGCISPWNLPLYLFTWKIAPALAAGNCVIAKPSEVTPLTAHMITKICSQAGLPDGVLNIVYGDGPTCGAAIVAHPDIKAISFTGSTRAGAAIAKVAGPMFKKTSLELGGKNPTLIFADCDWTKMIKTIVQSSFANQGQICLCGSRLLIEKSIYEKFKAEFLAAVQQLTVGHPLLETSKQGAIVSKAHYEKILACINIAKQEGGNILIGGHALQLEGDLANGFYIAPTVIENLGPHCTTNMEEIFGPVVTLQSFENFEEAVSLANTSNYGLAASVWTQDITKATTLGHQLNCGIVWINTWLHRDLRTPFGGMQHSGVGREGGWDAFKFFTEPKNICIVY
jgi:aminomuconate-semialdehyde/2-hydroxymuconate-6-semialdehyde dehydrogenase